MAGCVCLCVVLSAAQQRLFSTLHNNEVTAGAADAYC